jgi:hypothetical protein
MLTYASLTTEDYFEPEFLFPVLKFKTAVINNFNNLKSSFDEDSLNKTKRSSQDHDLTSPGSLVGTRYTPTTVPATVLHYSTYSTGTTTTGPEPKPKATLVSRALRLSTCVWY